MLMVPNCHPSPASQQAHFKKYLKVPFYNLVETFILLYFVAARQTSKFGPNSLRFNQAVNEFQNLFTFSSHQRFWDTVL